jgi:hypothetical protein
MAEMGGMTGVPNRQEILPDPKFVRSNQVGLPEKSKCQ